MTKEIIYETPISCLRRLIEHDQSQNFDIILEIVNKDSNLETKKIKITTSINKARIISKNINDIFLIDPTVDKYEIKYQIKSTKLARMQDKITEIMNKLINSIETSVPIQEDEKNDFYRLLIQLGEKTSNNEYEIRKGINNIDEAISLLFTDFHDSSILYLSENLKEFLSKNINDKINIEIIKEIIDAYYDFDNQNGQQENNKYKEKQYEELFDIMIEKSEEETVIMHFLIKLKAEEMNEQMIEYIYEHLDDDIMNTEFSQIIFIIRHHYLTILKEKSRQNKIKETIEYNGNEFKGLIEFLERKYGENLENNNILKISGGGSINNSYPLTNLIKYEPNQINQHYYNYCSRSATESEGWIEFDFGKRKINLSSYAIRTNSCNENWNHPKSWRIFGSNDKEHWDILDHQSNCSDLRGKYKQHHFECSNKNENFYQYIKYIQDDNWISNTQQKFDIYLTCIEFFGSISSPDEQ